ncbi:MAG: patatin-like phospholipase family protein [Spirochaetaceae bacterium]|nr:patatin-like phospholipase family protein [Spirochaetaceae bacterium]
METQNSKIGIALSGGGIRATIFHLGVFKYLAEKDMLHQITHISSVSGASLCVALLFAHNSNKWPTDKQYLDDVLPRIEKTILKNNIQTAALVRLPFSPAYWGNKAALIAKMMREKWQVTGGLQDLPDTPRWEINCATFETGKNFRFTKERMGDYQIGHVKNPAFPLAEAAAASAGFPILIGPLKFDARKYQWDKEQKETTYYLWDGGVYDNMGIESLYKPGKGLADTDFLVVSNASAPSGYLHRNGLSSAKNLKRLLDITMDQVSGLRSRDIVANVMNQDKGLYINIGNNAEKIANAEDSKADARTAKELIAACMSAEQAQKVRAYETTLSSPTPENFRLILRHGYENAWCCDKCYGRG